jgi:toxin ParE1/3/4
MGKFRIELVSRVHFDMKEIYEYIAAYNHSAAMSFLCNVDRAISHLAEFPDIGAVPKHPKVAKRGYRMLIVDKYLIFYIVVGDVVQIHRVIYDKRNYVKLLV